MSIKRIIQEEVDDFDWVRNASNGLPTNKEELKYFIGWHFIWDKECSNSLYKTCKGDWGYNGRKWLIIEIDDNYVYFTDPETNQENEYNLRTFINNILMGSWVLVSPEGVLLDPLYNRTYSPSLTESEEDEWDWTKGSIFIDELYEGLKIRVHNLGDENSFLNWIGSSNRIHYIRGHFGDHIEGEIYGVGDRLFSLRTKYGTIYFPSNPKEMEKVRKENQNYKGLHISYEPI